MDNKMVKMKFDLKLIIVILLLLENNTIFAQQPSREMVIAQMNCCINSLTNIINNKSMSVLDHETDQLVNNLTMEHLGNLYEVADFREALLESVGNLQITEEERNILRRVNEMKRNALLWQSLSEGLDPTMLLMPGQSAKQMVFYTLLTVARTAVEYKFSQEEQNIGELQAMWNLHKEDLKEFITLRKDAIDLEYNLFRKYKLSENDRLTENTATQFNEICQEQNPQKRLRLLLDNVTTYGKMADYYYFVGMTYIDLNMFYKAKPYLNKYLNMYKNTPIFRYDEKSGCIDLALLSYDKSLSNEARETLINSAIKNLPNNGSAIIQCVLFYLQDIKNPTKAYELLRSGIDNLNADCKNTMVMLAAQMLNDIKSYPAIYKGLSDAVFSADGVSLNSIVAFMANSESPDLWNNDIISFSHVYHHPWYFLWLFGNRILNDDFRMSISSKYMFDLNNIQVYKETYDGENLSIVQNLQKFRHGLNKEEILDDVDCFKANPGLMRLFLKPIMNDSIFVVKHGIDYSMIKSGSFPGLSEFTLNKDDADDIIDFCEDNEIEKQDEYELNSNSFTVPEKDIDWKYYVQDYLWRYPLIDNPENRYKTTTDAKNDKSQTKNTLSEIFETKKYKISFKGDTLTYNPYLLKVHPESSIKVVLNGPSKTILTYVLDKTAESGITLFSVESNGKIIFRDFSLLLKEIHAKEIEMHKEDNSPSWLEEIGNWFSNIWDKISSLWKSDESEEKDNQLKNSSSIKTDKSMLKDCGAKNTFAKESKHAIKNKSYHTTKDSSKSWYQKIMFWK